MYYDDSHSFQNENQSFDEVEAFFNWKEIENCRSSQEVCTTEEADGTRPLMPSSEASIDVSSAQKPLVLVFPSEDMELDDQLSITHLLKACGEAMESQDPHLVEAILRRLQEKACPKGSAAQKLVYYLIQSLDEHFDYLTQEARKNYKAAFRAFYQIFPYGRFAHFMANSSILEALPDDAEIIHIVDFDMGEGVQWPSLIEALGKQRQRVLRLLSVKTDNFNSLSPLQSLKKTKDRLLEHGASCGLKLEVEEVEMEGLWCELKEKENFRGREWLAFNCMVGLPHMGRPRNSRHVEEFLKIAQETIGKRSWNGDRRRGVLTFGNGNVVEKKMRDFGGFGAFFEAQLGHVTALLESMECQVPSHLKEAIIAMECLFVAPYASSLLTCFEKVEERDWGRGLIPKMVLDARRISKDIIAEAKELVQEGNSLYWIGTEGESENRVVLCFVGTPLVRFSTWS